MKHLPLNGMAPLEIHQDMMDILAENAPSYATVRRWVSELKRDRKNIEDEAMSWRPITIITNEKPN